MSALLLFVAKHSLEELNLIDCTIKQIKEDKTTKTKSMDHSLLEDTNPIQDQDIIISP